MTLEPFYSASLAIQIHMIAAIGAFILGAVVLWKKKGGKVHRLNGRIWVALMMVTALSGFFIHEIQLWGDFSPIHIFSITTPIGLIYAIYAIRQGRVEAHVNAMRGTYIGGMVFAGGFTFLPGRLNYEILFGEGSIDVFEQAGGWLIPIVAGSLIALYISRREVSSNRNR